MPDLLTVDLLEQGGQEQADRSRADDVHATLGTCGRAGDRRDHAPASYPRRQCREGSAAGDGVPQRLLGLA